MQDKTVLQTLKRVQERFDLRFSAQRKLDGNQFVEFHSTLVFWCDNADPNLNVLAELGLVTLFHFISSDGPDRKCHDGFVIGLTEEGTAKLERMEIEDATPAALAGSKKKRNGAL